MESLANNHASIDGNKRDSASSMTDTMLRATAISSTSKPSAAHQLITEAMEGEGFRFPLILDGIAANLKPLTLVPFVIVVVLRACHLQRILEAIPRLTAVDDQGNQSRYARPAQFGAASPRPVSVYSA